VCEDVSFCGSYCDISAARSSLCWKIPPLTRGSLRETPPSSPTSLPRAFSPYALELNPDEGVWSLAKRGLANSCPHDVDKLMEDVIRSINGIRTSPARLRGCIVQSEMPSFLR